MFRKIVPLALGIAFVLGCGSSKKGGSSDPEPTGPPITIKLRDYQQGDKTSVNESKTMSVALKVNGPKGKSLSQTKKSIERAEYAETILEKPPTAERPTRVSQQYAVAEKTEDGKRIPLSYAKKTLMIEKKPAGYAYTVNGVPLPEAEARTFRNKYDKTESLKNQDLLPNQPVQVNERWTLDPNVLRKLGQDQDLPLKADQSGGTGRLTKTYTKNGQQWGTIEVSVDLAIDGMNSGAKVTGNVNVGLLIDTPIDGSATEAEVKSTVSGRLVMKQPAQGSEMEMQLTGEGTETRTTLK